MEQTPINTEVGKSLNITIEEIDATQNPQCITEFQLKVTPTIVILKEGILLERFKGFVHAEQLTAALKKYL